MALKLILKVLLIVFLFTNLSYAELCSFSDADLTEVEKLLLNDRKVAIEKLSKFKCAIYTQSFAKRFNLPSIDHALKMNTGIEAIEFRFEKGFSDSPAIDSYFTRLLLYIDNSQLKVKMPGDLEESNWNLSNPLAHFFTHPRERTKEWNEEDRNRLYGYYHRHKMLSFLSEDKYRHSKKGHMVTCTNVEHVKNFLLGIDYLKLELPFRSVPEPKAGKNTLLWMRKQTGKDYTDPKRKITLEDFYLFELPERFYSRIYRLCQLIERTRK